MDPIAAYQPMVRHLAASFSKNRQTQEDLEQEGLIKVHQVISKHPGEDYETPDWRRAIKRCLKNLMIDHVRKTNRRAKWQGSIDNPEIKPEDLLHQDSYQLEELTIKYAVEELNRLLPELERRILSELIQPSEEFSWYVRRKNALVKIAKDKMNLLIPHRSNDETAIADFLGIKHKVFWQSMNLIRKKARRYGLGPSIFKNR